MHILPRLMSSALLQFVVLLTFVVIIFGATGTGKLGTAILLLGTALILLRRFLTQGTLTKKRLVAVNVVGLLGISVFLAQPSSEALSTPDRAQSPQSVQAPQLKPHDGGQSDAAQSTIEDGANDEDATRIRGESIVRRGVTAALLPGYTANDYDLSVKLLASLPVKGRAPKTGYSREQFGQRWADIDRNGCDTRNDILGRDLQDVEVKRGTRHCKVLRGTLLDPYTAQTIHFVSGPKSSQVVQIDHVVALSDAWQKGAQLLSGSERTAFANDPLNLLAVDGKANQQKGDADAATWLPKNKSFRCTYVARQIAVKSKYKLWVTEAEKKAMEGILDGCEKPAPQPAPAPSPEPSHDPQPLVEIPEEPAPAPEPESAPAPEPQQHVYYKNCKEAKAANAAPLYVDDPGYRPGLDRDGDGIACER